MPQNNPTRTPPPVKFDISPLENGKVVYQKLAPPVAGEPNGGMVYFVLKAKNQTEETIIAREMVVSFPGTTIPPIELPSRDVTIRAGATETLGLAGLEAIQLPAGTNPSNLRITLTFDGLPDPVICNRELAPHAKTYDFFSKPEPGSDYGEFVLLPGIHANTGGGSQHFAYDVKTVGVNNEGKFDVTRNGSTNNADYFLWGRPLYAMADGIVVRAIDDHEDNPGARLRTVARKAGSYQGTVQIDAVSVANLSPETGVLDMSRMFIAVRSGEQIRVLALEQNADGSQLNYLSGEAGSNADGAVSAAGITETLAVTAHSNGGHTWLTLWGIAGNGSSITVKDTKLVSQITDAKVVKLTSDRVALLGRTTEGNLTLTLHSWQPGQAAGSLEFLAPSLGSATGGGVEKLDLVRLSSTRLAAALQTPGGNLKIIVWDLVPEGIMTPGGGVGSITLTRVGEREGQGTINEVALASMDETQLITTAVRTSEGQVKLIAWEVLPSGALERRGDIMDDSGTQIDLSFFKSEAYAVTYRTESGKLRLVAWDAEQNEDTRVVTFSKLYQRETDGDTNLYSVARIPTEQPTLVTAVRTQTGVLKVILWQFTDSNLIYILHGNEMAVFAHLQENSVPNALLTPGTPVSKGQFIGRMGNSGKAAGPHTHFHVLRIWDDLVADVGKLIEALEVGNDNIGEFRPVHFRNVRAMRSAGAVSGWSNNPMTLLDGQGTYFENYIVWPSVGAAEPPPVLTVKEG